MSVSKFFYIDVSATFSEQTGLTYGTLSMGMGDILFAIGALENSDQYDSYEDMVNHYPQSTIPINLKNPDLKVPILRVHKDENGFKTDLYCLIDTLFTEDYVDPSTPQCGLCHTAPSIAQYIELNLDGSVTMPAVE